MKRNPDLLAFLIGLALFGVGLSLWYLPAGPIGIGAVLIFASLFGPSRREQP